MLDISLKGRESQRSTPASDEPTGSELPDYAPLLAAFHEEFAAELRSVLARLPIGPGDHILDVACGDGRYAAWLAERAGTDGSVTAVDASPAWLAVAGKTLRGHGKMAD